MKIVRAKSHLINEKGSIGISSIQGRGAEKLSYLILELVGSVLDITAWLQKILDFKPAVANANFF